MGQHSSSYGIALGPHQISRGGCGPRSKRIFQAQRWHYSARGHDLIPGLLKTNPDQDMLPYLDAPRLNPLHDLWELP